MKKLDKKIMLTAAILGAITIAIGAFGAHGLKQLIDGEALKSFETGVRYQMYHVIAMLVVGCWGSFSNKLDPETLDILQNTKKWTFRFFCFGVLLFSGSIYLLSFEEVMPFSVYFLWPLTPIGGLLLILGWLRLGYGIFKLKSQYSK